MRLLNQPKNVLSVIAGENLKAGEFVLINNAGKAVKPTSAAEAVNAVYVVAHEPANSNKMAGYSEEFKAGTQVTLVNGALVEFDTGSVNNETWSSVAKGSLLGITATGKLASSANSATNTVGIARLIDVKGSIVIASVDFRV